MKYLIIILGLITISCSSPDKEKPLSRKDTKIDTTIEDYDFIAKSISLDTTLIDINIVRVGDYDYVIDKDRNVVATYDMSIEEEETFDIQSVVTMVIALVSISFFIARI
jgi:hypothetical protein